MTLRLRAFLLLTTGLLISSSVRSQTVTTFASGILTPAGLAFDSNGNLYVAQSTSSAATSDIKKITPTGTVSTFVQSSTNNYFQPTGVAVDANNNVYFSTGNTNRTIRRVTPQGTVSTFANIGASAISYVAGDLAFGPDGNLYAAQNVNPNRILQITPAGVVNTYVGTTAAGYNGTYGTNYGVAFRNGELYFSDNRTGSTAFSRIFRASSPENIQAVYTAASGLNAPSGLAFAANGDLYVANTGTNSILKITPTGVATTFLTALSVGSATGTNLNRPTDLAFDAAGNLYISDQVNNRIVKVSLNNATLTGFAANPAQVCAGQPTTFTATVSGLTSGTYSYTISNGSGSSATASAISVSTTAISQSLTASGSGVQTYTLTVSSGSTSLTQTTNLTVNTPPAVSLITSASSVCPGSVVTLTASTTAGSSNSFQYAFNGTASQASSTTTVTPGLGTNNYQVLVTDGNSCTASATTVVTGNANPTPTLVVSGPITCTSNAILTADGGNTGGPFSYTFTNPSGSIIGSGASTGTSATAIATSEGTYTVQVANVSGCISSTTAPVTSNTVAPQGLTLVASGTLTCTQTSVQLTAGSSTGGVSYVFSAGATPNGANTATVTQAGSYTVTVTGANGCSSFTTTTVSSNTTAPTATLSSSGPISSTSPTVTLTANATPASGNTYAFSPGATQQGNGNTATVSSPGVYSVTVTRSDNGCTTTASTTVAGGTDPATICRNGTAVIRVTTTGAPAKYEWYRNSLNSPRLAEITNLQRGTATSSLTLTNQQVTANYYVRVTDQNGTSVVYGPFKVTVNMGCVTALGRLAAEEVELKVTLLGNPLIGEQLRATVQGASGKALSVQLLDLQGHSIRQQTWQQAESDQPVEWNMGGQASGVYLLQATTADQRHSLKVIKP